LKSYIALAKTQNDDNSGRVTVSDVLDKLNIKTDIVIMAACETGRGKESADGVIGLSRSFIQAGSPTLLMSLWPIPEEDTLDQMWRFHEYWLSNKLSKAEALRNVQLERIKEYREQPNIWAGFALFGNWK